MREQARGKLLNKESELEEAKKKKIKKSRICQQRKENDVKREFEKE